MTKPTGILVTAAKGFGGIGDRPRNQNKGGGGA